MLTGSWLGVDQGDRGRDGSDSEEQEHILPLGYERLENEFGYEWSRLTIGEGQLKAKLAKLKRELLTPSGGGGGGGGGEFSHDEALRLRLKC